MDLSALTDRRLVLAPGDAGYDDELAGFQTGYAQRPDLGQPHVGGEEHEEQPDEEGGELLLVVIQSRHDRRDHRYFAGICMHHVQLAVEIRDADGTAVQVAAGEQMRKSS